MTAGGGHGEGAREAGTGQDGISSGDRAREAGTGEDATPPGGPGEDGPTAGRRRARRRVVAAALIAAVAVAAIGGAVAAALDDRAHRVLPLDLPGPRTASVHQLTTGHCLGELPLDGPVHDVRVVPCADRHRAEVRGVHRFPQDGLWPGARHAERRVRVSCESEGVRAGYGSTLVVWAPTEASWSDGDRTGLCLVADAGTIPEG